MEQKLTPAADNTTIAAPATPLLPSAIILIRMSGPDALSIASRVWKGRSLHNMESHTLRLGKIIDTMGDEIDSVVLSYFKGPNSFTGEDCIEISSHGSPFIAAKILHALSEAGAVPATPGEFSKRAFINGKIDLTQAEAIADMIAADSDAARQIALGHLKGDISRETARLREQLINTLTLLELELDFSEEDVTFADRSQLENLLSETIRTLRAMQKSFMTGTAVRDGIQIAILGAPNAGKSTLLNRLLQDEKAIVSDFPGTTRDIIEDTLHIGPLKFRFIDTAGIRLTDDPVEQLGIEKAITRARNASLIILLLDATQDLTEQRNTLLQALDGYLPPLGIITLINKTDVTIPSELPDGALCIAATDGTGINDLTDRLLSLSASALPLQDSLVITNERHNALISDALSLLERAREAMYAGLSADFIAQDIRHALHHLSELIGEITTPTVLHSIFSSFCIGK